MRTHLHIVPQKHQQWQRLSHGWWIGHVYHQDRWLTTQEVDASLQAIDSIGALQQLLQDWNGHFAFQWAREGLEVAVTDLARSYPIFWQVKPESTIISNQPDTEAAASWWQESKVLTQTEFVPGHATLYQGWQQLQAGEILEVKGSLCYIHNYFPHRRPAPKKQSETEWAAAFNQLLEQIFERLIQYADGNAIVVPLSGGFDSRIIVAALHKLGYTNLKAFTYGQEDSLEVRIGKEVAQQLNLDWQFVPYTSELIEEFGTKEWPDYANFASKGGALFQEQDFFALQQLRKSGWLEAGSIICPGYCGDFQAGSYLPQPGLPWPPNRKLRLHEQLITRFFRYPDDQLRQMLRPLLPQGDVAHHEEYVSELEHWVLREYVTKFIVNGVRAFEWFDCAWHLPLWDKAFIQFWQAVPNEFRKGMWFYRKILAEDWFTPYSLLFPEDEIKTQSAYSPKAWLPPQWKKKLKSYLPSQHTQNINGLQQLIPLIQERLAWPEEDLNKPVNEMLGHWYHDQLNSNTV